MINDRSITCPNCGGDIIGDGYTEVRRFEFADESLCEDREPDSNVVYCKEEKEKE